MIKLTNEQIITQLQEDYEEETQKLKDRIELLENSLDDTSLQPQSER